MQADLKQNQANFSRIEEHQDVKGVFLYTRLFLTFCINLVFELYSYKVKYYVKTI